RAGPAAGGAGRVGEPAAEGGTQGAAQGGQAGGGPRRGRRLRRALRRRTRRRPAAQRVAAHLKGLGARRYAPYCRIRWVSPSSRLRAQALPARSIGRMSAPATSIESAIRDALATVQDPEIHRPI